MSRLIIVDDKKLLPAYQLDFDLSFDVQETTGFNDEELKKPVRKNWWIQINIFFFYSFSSIPMKKVLLKTDKKSHQVRNNS